VARSGFISQERGALPLTISRAPGAGLANWRAHFGAWAVVAGVAFVALLVAAPPVPAGMAAEALTGRPALSPGMSSPWLLLAPVLARFPLGDGAAHVRLLSLAAAAIMVALSLWRATDHRLVRREQPAVAPELVAVVFGVLAVVLSSAFFRAATAVGPVAGGALLALGLLALAERSLRSPTHARAGMGLALCAGAAAGGPMTAAVLGWPLAAVAVARAARRGARWSRSASAAVLCGAGAVAALVVLLRAPGGVRLGAIAGHVFLVPVFRVVARLPAVAFASAAGDLADQVGVVALLVAATGLVRLRPMALLFTLWPLAGGLIMRAAGGAGDEGAVGLIVALASLALPIGAGIARLADRLGRAALPATVAIGVIVTSWPLLAR
jgi:hypothetical protein